jgi:hypothetical protein
MPVKSNGRTITDKKIVEVEDDEEPAAEEPTARRRLKGGGGGGGGRARSKAKARKKCERDDSGETSDIKDAIEPVVMNRIHKKMICGKKGGAAF